MTKLSLVGRVRAYWWVSLVLLPACAHKGPSAEDRLKQRCEINMQSDPRCMDLLTGAETPYESRAQVMAAEKTRKQNEFDSKLSRLRAQEEERALARLAEQKAATSTLARFGLPQLPTPLIQTVSMVPAPAPAPAPGATPKTTAPPPPPVVKPAIPTAHTTKVMATPETWIHAARCVLNRWIPDVQAHLTARRRKEPTARGELGAWALVLVEAQGLESELESELQRRGLPAPKNICSVAAGRPARNDLAKTLVRPQVGTLSAEAAAGRVQAVRGHLETYAGLPKAQ